MRAFQQNGKVVTLTAPYIRTSGQGALVGSKFGVAVGDVASGAEGEFLTEGVVVLAKTSAQAHAQGDIAYWDDTNKRIDNTVVGPRVGVILEVAANPSSTTVVKLDECANKSPQAAETTIATANATDLATAEALANALKVTVNSLLVKLRAAGIILP